MAVYVSRRVRSNITYIEVPKAVENPRLVSSIEERSKAPTRAEVVFYEGLVNFVLVLKGDRSS